MKIKAVSKTYGDRCVLQMPETGLSENTVHVVLGANGSGKSTWAKILGGIIRPDGNGNPFAAPVRVGYMPQKPFAFRMSTEQNLRIAANDRKREEALLSMLRLESLRKAGAHRLSGGETARMALARILMKRFDLLILDEPCAAMDMESTILAEQAVLRYREETGAAILLITHSIRQAERMGDRLLFLKEGKLAESGDCRKCFSSPATAELRTFLDFYGGNAYSKTE